MRSMTWNRLLTVALLVAVATFIAIMAISRVLIPPLIVFSVLFVGLVWALPRWGGERRWLYIVTAVLAVVLLALNLPFIIGDLVHPETFASFVPAAVGALALVIAAVAAVAVFTGRRPDAARPIALAAAALVVAGMLGSAAATAAAGDIDRAEGDIDVVAEKFDYPETLSAKPGKVAFFIENRDVVRHTFAIEGEDVDQELPAQRSRRVEVQLPAGTYHYFCSVPGHEDLMSGTLEVR